MNSESCDLVTGCWTAKFQRDDTRDINIILLRNMDWSPSPKERNKLMKMYNGNVKGCINIMHWNLGSKRWEKKIDEVQLLVDQYSPDHLFISEANLFQDVPDHLTGIEGYVMTRASTMEHLKYSRIVLLSKIGSAFTVEWNRMDKEVSSIWIKIGSRGNKSLRLGGIYREHTLIRQPEPNHSNDQGQQERRWKKFISQWRAAGNSGPCVIIGDVNLDMLKWNAPENGQNNMIELVKTDIETINMSQVIEGPTRFWVGTQPSLIDQCWANAVDRICNIKNITRGAGDHNMISISYKFSGKVSVRLESKGRDRRKYSPEELKRRLRLTDWSTVFDTQNVDIANTEFEDKFVEIMNELAPMGKTQPRKKRSDWISPETKDLMRRRDRTRELAVRSSQREDWTEYRNSEESLQLKSKTG